MKTARTRALVSAAFAAIALACAAPAALAQAGPYQPPRNAWGKPDFEGNWTDATVTGMTRPAGLPLVLNAEQAAKLEGGALINVRSSQKDAAYVDPNAGAPEKGKPLPGVGNYDVAYTDPGTKVLNINGELRSSFITFPEDGRIPAMTDEGKALRASMGGGRRGNGYDNPEERGLGERCIIIGNAGPPLSVYLYNNNFQIVQTPDNMLLVSEMIHDVRDFKIGAKPSPSSVVQPYHGDSIAHWDGDTLVVETRNMAPQQRVGRVFLSKDGVVTEKFTRISDTQILYDFEINDPHVYTTVWKGQMALTKMNKPLYEYACAEGNYALPGILKGGRSDDRLGKAHTAVGRGE